MDAACSIPEKEPGRCVTERIIRKYGAALIEEYIDGRDEEFSFADAYSPDAFGKRRFCDARRRVTHPGYPES